MLYDNALLTIAYLEAYQVTARPEFARVAQEVLAYVQREMTAPSGAFYSATDADSEGEEGTFFVWTPAGIEEVLTPEEQRLVLAYYAVTKQGNFEGKNILHTPRSLEAVATELGIDSGQAQQLLDAAREKLYEARRKREPPHTDRKILASWNGLMISAFARASQVYPREAQLFERIGNEGICWTNRVAGPRDLCQRGDVKVIRMPVRNDQNINRRELVWINGSPRARHHGPFFEGIEEHRVHQTGGAVHLDQQRRMPKQGNPHGCPLPGLIRSSRSYAGKTEKGKKLTTKPAVFAQQISRVEPLPITGWREG